MRGRKACFAAPYLRSGSVERPFFSDLDILVVRLIEPNRRAHFP
jgi:hypothetical protein